MKSLVIEMSQDINIVSKLYDLARLFFSTYIKLKHRTSEGGDAALDK